MKKLLIAAVIFSVAGVAQGYAQDLYQRDACKSYMYDQNAYDMCVDRVEKIHRLKEEQKARPGKFEDFTAKMKAAKQYQSDYDAYKSIATDPPVSNAVGAPEQISTEEGASPPSDPLAGMIIAKSEIKAVIVYNNRARVTRVAEVEIPAGTHTMAFTDMPKSLFTDSLRAEGSAKAAVKFGAITQKTVTISHSTAPQEKELNNKIIELQDQKLPIEAELKAIQAQSKFLRDVSAQAVSGSEKLPDYNLKPDQWLNVAQTIHSGMSDALKAELQQNVKLREIDRQIQKIQSDIRNMQTPTRNVYTVLVPLEAENATKLSIELSYQVPNATWHPLYDARVSTDGKSDLKIVQYGSVRQRTGEDWKNVSLTLSTAQPRSATRMDELEPIWINAYEIGRSFVGGDTSGAKQTVGQEVNDPEYVKKLSQQNKKLAEQQRRGGGSFVPTPIAPAENQTLSLPATPMQGDPLAEWRAKTEAKSVQFEQPEQQAAFSPAVVNTGGFVSEYKIQGPSSVSTGGADTKLLIGNFDVESKLQVHVKPQLSADAYLIAHSKLKGESPLLEGPVNLFRDEAYVGQSILPLLRPGEEYNISFGIDDQVSVKHKLLKDEKRQAGIISKENIRERSFVTELQNLHNVPVDIVTQEMIPSALNEKISIAIISEVTTPGYTANADNTKGLLNWQFKMEPKAKKELKLEWTVNWPNDYMLTGL
jgi:hypothetical protein